MMKTHIIKTCIAFLLFSFISTIYGCYDEEKELTKEPPAKIKQEKKTVQKVDQPVKNGKTPPPLLPAKEEPDFTLDDIMQKMKDSEAEKEKFEENQSEMYKYVDSEGQMHIVSHLHLVPTQYRDKAIAIAKTEKPKTNGSSSIYSRLKQSNQKNDSLTKQSEINKSFRKKYKKLADLISDLEKALKNAKANPPDCNQENEDNIEIIESDDNADEDAKAKDMIEAFGVGCMYKHKLRIENLENKLKIAKAELKALREDARKAGVPPGYMR